MCAGEFLDVLFSNVVADITIATIQYIDSANFRLCRATFQVTLRT